MGNGAGTGLLQLAMITSPRGDTAPRPPLLQRLDPLLQSYLCYVFRFAFVTALHHLCATFLGEAREPTLVKGTP